MNHFDGFTTYDCSAIIKSNNDNDDDKIFVCHTCGERFSNRGDLIEHKLFDCRKKMIKKQLEDLKTKQTTIEDW